MIVLPELTLQGIGVSQFMSLDGTSRICDFIKNQDLTIQFEKTLKEVMGGDGLFPIDSFYDEAKGNVALTAAQMDFESAKAFAGANAYAKGADTLWKIAEQILVPATTPYTYTLEMGAVLVATSDRLRYLDTATDTYLPMTRVGVAPAAITEYQISAAGLITFHSTAAGKTVRADYQYTATNTEGITVTTIAVPQYGMFVHRGNYIKTDGSLGVVQTTIYKCRFRGAIQFDWKRGEAVAPKLEFQLFDPGRADKGALKIVRVV